MLSARSLTLMMGVLSGVALTLGAQGLLGDARAEKAPLKGTITAKGEGEVRQLGGGKATITHLARGERAYLGRLTLKGGVNVPLHRDPTEEYLVIEQGSGELFINGVGHKVAPGSVVFMPAGAEVRFTNSDQALVALQVFAGPESADKYAKWAVVK